MPVRSAVRCPPDAFSPVVVSVSCRMPRANNVMVEVGGEGQGSVAFVPSMPSVTPGMIRHLYGIGNYTGSNPRNSIALTGFLNQFVSLSDQQLFFTQFDPQHAPAPTLTVHGFNNEVRGCFFRSSGSPGLVCSPCTTHRRPRFVRVGPTGVGGCLSTHCACLCCAVPLVVAGRGGEPRRAVRRVCRGGRQRLFLVDTRPTARQPRK